MTIYCYTGTVGTGKSLDAARKLRWHLATGRPAIGNFELATDCRCRNADGYKYVSNEELTPELLWDYAESYWQDGRVREDTILLIVDECQCLWNSRRWSDRDRLAWVEFFSQSRKAGYEVILIAQSSKMVDNQFRMVIEYEVAHRKLSKYGFWGWLLALPFRGRVFSRQVRLMQTGEVMESGLFYGHKRYFAMYDTYKRFERKKTS